MVTNSKFVWTREDTLGIAAPDCIRCHGLGLEDGRLESTQPCPCVLRAIFRTCCAKFRELAIQPRLRAIGWARRDEEYMADFVRIAKRTLDEEPHRVFRTHFLLGASENLCIERLALDRGAFFHAVHQIEQRVGRALREAQPHSLYPIDEYFR
jgi:hypothetical protein